MTHVFGYDAWQAGDEIMTNPGGQIFALTAVVGIFALRVWAMATFGSGMIDCASPARQARPSETGAVETQSASRPGGVASRVDDAAESED